MGLGSWPTASQRLARFTISSGTRFLLHLTSPEPVQQGTLQRYKKQFNLDTSTSGRADLLEVVTKHFISMVRTPCHTLPGPAAEVTFVCSQRCVYGE